MTPAGHSSVSIGVVQQVEKDTHKTLHTEKLAASESTGMEQIITHSLLSSPDKVSVVPTASCGPAMVRLVKSCLSIGLRVVKNVNISAFLSRAWWGPAHTFIEG